MIIMKMVIEIPKDANAACIVDRKTTATWNDIRRVCRVGAAHDTIIIRTTDTAINYSVADVRALQQTTFQTPAMTIV